MALIATGFPNPNDPDANGRHHARGDPPRPLVAVAQTNRGEFLTPGEFAGLLKLSRAMFFKLKSAGGVPSPAYFGRLPRWWRPEIEDWIQAGRPRAAEWEQVKASGRLDSRRGGPR
jgi:predicted DNA-binding transcriptional regulator AlpA